MGFNLSFLDEEEIVIVSSVSFYISIGITHTLVADADPDMLPVETIALVPGGESYVDKENKKQMRVALRSNRITRRRYMNSPMCEKMEAAILAETMREMATYRERNTSLMEDG